MGLSYAADRAAARLRCWLEERDAAGREGRSYYTMTVLLAGREGRSYPMMALLAGTEGNSCTTALLSGREGAQLHDDGD